jgi:D-alanyl-lipoteichoic acid acyltransferase DltB (MBOAT superfamily)
VRPMYEGIDSSEEMCIPWMLALMENSGVSMTKLWIADVLWHGLRWRHIVLDLDLGTIYACSHYQETSTIHHARHNG